MTEKEEGEGCNLKCNLGQNAIIPCWLEVQRWKWCKIVISFIDSMCTTYLYVHDREQRREKEEKEKKKKKNNKKKWEESNELQPWNRKGQMKKQS